MAGYIPPYMQQGYGYMPQQLQQPTMMQPVQAQQQYTDINWVQGENGAKSALVGPGQTKLLMDSEARRFYIKTADMSGMPLPLRRFSYTEDTEQAVPQHEQITRGEFDQVRDTVAKLQAAMEQMRGGAANAESAV